MYDMCNLYIITDFIKLNIDHSSQITKIIQKSTKVYGNTN